MFQNYLKITLRQFARNKTATLINFSGLTIGLAAAMLIGVYVLNEWQTDRDLPHPDRTFRLLRVSAINNQPYDIGVTSGPFAGALKQDFPADIEETVRVLEGHSLVQTGERRFHEEHYYYADPNFLTFFNFPLLHGDPRTALSQLHGVVLTRETARRYFGDENRAMGQTLRIDNQYDAVVTGVMAELEKPVHFQFDLIESTLDVENAPWWKEWWNNSAWTYLRLAPGASATALQEKFPAFMDKYFGKDFAVFDTRIGLRLQPLRSVYFEADTRYDEVRHGNRQAVEIFFVAALLLILIACANYVNLSTAKAAERGKEVGVYKVLGSGRRQIIGQMLGESLLMSFISVVAAAQLAWLAMPWFGQLFGATLKLSIPVWVAAAALGSIALLVGLAAGWYPGWFLSAFKPAAALRGSTGGDARQSAGLRKALVVFQFVLSVGLLCSTLLIQRQLDFLREKNLGFDKEHVLLLSCNNPDIYKNRTTFRQMLEREPGVLSLSFNGGAPGGYHDGSNVQFPEQNKSVKMRTAFGDFDYFNTLGLQMVAGRPFSREMATDSTGTIIFNEQAVRAMGLTPEAAIGQKALVAFFDTIPRTIIGVVKDYHFASLRDAIEPEVISVDLQGRELAIKVQAGQMPRVIAAAEKAWNRFSPAYPFEYHFLDERLDQLYLGEARQGKIFALFAGIAIFIACLGMFGLSAYAAALRAKEIGIRKVLGASAAGIVGLLSKDFLKLVVIAFFIAAPLAWYFMDHWLADFAYRIDMPWWVFALAGSAAVAVAFLTIGAQSLKAALSDPVKSLRSE